MRIRPFILAALACGMTVACTDGKMQKEARQLLDRAQSEYAAKRYDQALHTIDSLRKTYPEALAARKEALKLYQQVALSQAQDNLARTDSQLEKVKAEYASMKRDAEDAKRRLCATAEQLQAVTLKKMQLDSLQVQFDVECAKIKYIHKKQKE